MTDNENKGQESWDYLVKRTGFDDGPATTVKEIVHLYLEEKVVCGYIEHGDYDEFIKEVKSMVGRLDGYGKEFKEALSRLLSSGFRNEASREDDFNATYDKFSPIRSKKELDDLKERYFNEEKS
jgi:hypothetical protein